MISQEIQTLLDPLERFGRLHRRFSRLGPRLVDLSYANFYSGVSPEVRNALVDAARHDRKLGLQYAPFGGKLLPRRAVAESLRESHHPGFRFRDITLTPGAMAALHLALIGVGPPGSEVLIPTPCWLDYPVYVRQTGLSPILIPLSGPDFDLDPDALLTAVSPRTRALLLAHPGNPTGRSFNREALEDLADILGSAERRHETRIEWITDEAHRDFIPAGQYVSPMRVWSRTTMVYSFGKYHLIQGQRTGYLAVSPDHPDRKALQADRERWARITGFATPTALMQHAIPALLGVRHEVGDVHRRREHFRADLIGAGYTVAPANGTLFLYVGTPVGWDDWSFIEELASQGVLALPAPIFHHSGYFRLALTAEADGLERAIAVLKSLGPAS